MAKDLGAFYWEPEDVTDGVSCSKSCIQSYILVRAKLATVIFLVPRSMKCWKHSPKTKKGEKKVIPEDYHEGMISKLFSLMSVRMNYPISS